MKKNKKIFQNKKQKITIIFLIIFFIFEVIYNVVNIINKKTIYENTILRFQQVERKFNSNDQSDNEQIKLTNVLANYFLKSYLSTTL